MEEIYEKKFYTIWTEDEGSWLNENGGFVTDNKNHATKVLKEYCKINNVEHWIKQKCAYVSEVRFDKRDV